jgi:UDP-N-acetyl-D-galactosamine dehydrogenase
MVKIGVIGLGYVGLPLAVEFGKIYETVGFDLKEKRIAELRAAKDSTLETSSEQLRAAVKLRFTLDPEDLRTCNFYIVTVPTPVDAHNAPDLSPLKSASAIVGKLLKKRDIVVYESTVFPGCTEEECVPILERESGLRFNADFSCGYSPERINPGDKEHTLTRIRKITSGSNPEAAEVIDGVYSSIIAAGTYRASSIKVAEAAKVIENSQRDINIAFVNELAKIFNALDIDTGEVLEAAGTKWNFLSFRPGLVGGHCIGVDPFYLTYRAQAAGYHPEVILAGRRLNDDMPAYVANRVIKLMIKKGHRIDKTKILVMGITFKENCPDIRNSKVVGIIRELQDFGCDVDIHDPWADPGEVRHEYGLELSAPKGPYDAIVLAVAHKEFAGFDVTALRSGEESVVFDVKGFLPKEIVDGRL